MKYDESLSAADNKMPTSKKPCTNANFASLKYCLHSNVPKAFTINSDLMHIEEVESCSKAIVPSSLNSPNFKFHETFRQLLENRYGLLSEKVLFGEGDGDVILLSDFQKLEKCSQLKDFKEFFLKQFPKPKDKDLLCHLQKSFADLFEEVKGDTSADQFHRLIKDEVTAYCFYLIDSRIRNMQVFEQFEEELHQKFTSYDFLIQPSSDDVKKKLLSLLQEINELGEEKTEHDKLANIADTQKKRMFYERQIKLYKEVLALLNSQNWIRTDSVMQCLDSNSNHYSYLHEHLYHLGVLLIPLQKRYSVSEGNSNRIFTLKMAAGTVSGALSALTESGVWLESGDEIRLCADTVLYLDQDIHFEGVNVVCFAPKLERKKSGKFCIKTDGKPLDSVNLPNKGTARSGDPGTEHGKDGTPGSHGENGRCGHAGGHILLVAQNICPDDFDLSANGSPGGDGQDGGDGGPGWTPLKDGEDGECPKFTSGWLRTGDAVIINYGTFGENGGSGGDAGMGGAPGKSGISGQIEIFDLQNEENCKKSEPVPIEDGKAGSPGKCGNGGKNRKHGMDWGAYAKKAHFGGWCVNLFTGSEQRVFAKDVRGELEHSSINPEPGFRAHHGKRNYEVSANSVPRQVKDAKHTYFNCRGRNNPGKKAQVKLNSTLSNENKAIINRPVLSRCISSVSNLDNTGMIIVQTVEAEFWERSSGSRFCGFNP